MNFVINSLISIVFALGLLITAYRCMYPLADSPLLAFSGALCALVGFLAFVAMQLINDKPED